MSTREPFQVIEGMPEKAFNRIIAGITHPRTALKPFYTSEQAIIYNEDYREVLARIPENTIDMIFADPPYKLSNNGFTCHNGRMAPVNKGAWDTSKGVAEDTAFHEAWIAACRRVLKPEGTLWISGTYHSIYQCGYVLQKQHFHFLNDIIWFKPNGSPNLSCRFFTASHETLLWVRKDKKAKHYFNYQAIKNGEFPEDKLKNQGVQMRSVWSIPTPAKEEKKTGKHPTQKPLSLLTRIILASTKPGDIILDPFNGSGTTGLACRMLGQRFYIGVEIEREFCELTERRLCSILPGDEGGEAYATQ
ncbi:MAG: site-specific DNA-methyltransferase [Treponema sp.]|jgi:site-specific DNA-methyltransferase (adenine-specific)|nr:site-specific DNA-methyltransferase [Treponema sp.]